ncbi:MAG: signal peptide peptidase SppA [Saprospiraceae bacterium]|jgi:protease-4|nr:signal peptide peptidase SppA [Saprospiraceae bacterium]MDP4698814.1 signal peptide peptidase SppA [Saprospiraceae bacterium]MDP4811027.1 signal peptide peptidase SppA [Saprospiraceae bacterium]MDP4814631.1 signal peptide peptidase SppA [Saprospiraceae bacterium]MDP4853064.1 signal peptide peptidase SppA [Saprospiraceae bacterium]
MLHFFRTLFASCLGTILALVAILLIGIAIAASFASEGNTPPELKPNTILRLTFNESIPELTNNAELDPFQSIKGDDLLGLHEIIATIENAKNDSRIKGIFLDMEMPSFSGYATVKSLRDALVSFKKSGKFIVAHSKFYMQSDYYLASVADKVYANPVGIFEVRGMVAEVPFYKNLLDKLGVKMQIYYAGKFKGATEPYRLTQLSTENKFQYRELLHDFYSTFLNDVATSRKLSPSQVADIVGNYKADSPENAKIHGLVDEVIYRQDVMDIFRKKLGFKENEKIPFVSLAGYHKANAPSKNYSADDKIAVIYAEGTIADGKSTPGNIGDLSYIKDIEKVSGDDRVKAVVLRVNSPGGSALASENIWYALKKLKKTGKPLVVSMGNYAASGGYYIACLADSILAEENTVTGSIGVFRIIPSVGGLLEDKVGVTFDTVKTGKYSQGLTVFFDIGEDEGRIMQKQVDFMYETFLKRVSDGRKLSRNAVDAIAQGRVWSGSDAIPIGLVDKIGNLQDAIKVAAKMSKSSDYRITEYPQVKNSVEQLFEDFMNPNDTETAIKRMSAEFPSWRPYLMDLHELRSAKGIQARMLSRVPVH